MKNIAPLLMSILLIGLIALKAGHHRIRVPMFQCKGGRYLEVLIKGPGLPKQPLSKEMLCH